MSDTSEGWDDQKSEDLSLEGIPKSWAGFSRAKKVEHLVSVIQVQLQKVRTGTFNHVKGERVAALALEGLLELADFYSDAEASAKNAKLLAEYTEGDVAAKYAKEAVEKEVRVSEASLKRMSSVNDEVKQSKKDMVAYEKEHKKWRYVYETLKEAHVFFRNIGKL